jgi:hypothetical protein
VPLPSGSHRPSFCIWQERWSIVMRIGGSEDLKYEHEAELARRQAALDTIARWAQTQQMINAMNRPVITSCNQFSGMVNCFSR